MPDIIPYARFVEIRQRRQRVVAELARHAVATPSGRIHRSDRGRSLVAEDCPEVCRGLARGFAAATKRCEIEAGRGREIRCRDDFAETRSAP